MIRLIALVSRNSPRRTLGGARFPVPPATDQQPRTNHDAARSTDRDCPTKQSRQAALPLCATSRSAGSSSEYRGSLSTRDCRISIIPTVVPRRDAIRPGSSFRGSARSVASCCAITEPGRPCPTRLSALDERKRLRRSRAPRTSVAREFPRRPPPRPPRPCAR